MCCGGMQGYIQICIDGKNNLITRFDLFIFCTLLKETATSHHAKVSHCGSAQVQAAKPTHPVWSTPMQLLPHSGSTKFPEALINLHERCLQPPSVPVCDPNYHSSIQPSPSWVFKPGIPLLCLSCRFQPAAVLTMSIVYCKAVHLSEYCTAGK